MGQANPAVRGRAKASCHLDFGRLQTAVSLRSAARVLSVHCAAVLAIPPFSARQNPNDRTPWLSPAAQQAKELKREVIFKIQLPWVFALMIVYRRSQ